jgi:hypothetical protein
LSKKLDTADLFNQEPRFLTAHLTGWRNKQETQTRVPSLPSDNEIPRDPQKFYEDFGLLKHPRTGEPSPKLTVYQYKFWKDGFYHQYRLGVKSQKVGLSTSVLMEDFQKAITSCKGYEILVICQTIDKARDHLTTLRHMILASKKYKPYLITRRTEVVLPDEVTRVTTLFIHNPDSPGHPTKIIGLGGNEASIWSWKEVKHIHMSDIAVITKKDYSGVINAAMTRLANTEGSIVIETPPYGPRGKVYEIYTQSKIARSDNPEGQFKIMEIPAREAVAAGLITNSFLEGEKVRLGSQYPAYYEAEFSAATGSVFHIEDIDAASAVPYSPDEPLPYGGVSCIGIDPGFGSSPFGICVSTFIDGKARIRFADEFPRPSHDEMALQIWDLIQHHNCNKVYIDNSSPSMIRSLKIHWGERTDYENIDRDQYRFMKVEPISFGREHKNMLAHAKMMIDKHYVAIAPGFEKLLVSLKTAVEHNGALDKEVTAYDNVFDSFRLCMLRYKEETKR